MSQQPQKQDPRDARIKELETELKQVREEAGAFQEHAEEVLAKAIAARNEAEQKLDRDLQTERDYLWAELAQFEAWAQTAPREAIASRGPGMLKGILDGFKPAVKVTREMP